MSETVVNRTTSIRPDHTRWECKGTLQDGSDIETVLHSLMRTLLWGVESERRMGWSFGVTLLCPMGITQ
ncbi:unnamed protein product [Fusarium graminearum]|uniref:Chromosome 1, complete genome n=1 Tax=Gibberella zeae (strain ATCC MYA-4620 / CBS 123657 / FGSC 9075 / NRRL 31084 / PH-1) TaxID=229533 RepID=A0A098CZJ5_GIBZE|nr:unnamed protein product [Fusarium graminearum]